MRASQVSEIDGVRISKIESASDSRGTFIKFHPSRELHTVLDSIAVSFNPIIGTIRGLHFQTEPFSEEKIITCIQGSIFDVVVDIRPGSRTFGRWASIELSADNSLQAYLPNGIAHGFQTLLPNSTVHYGITSIYSPESSYAIDPFGDLDIDWPVEILAISERDKNGISLSEAAQKYADSLKV